MAITLGVRQEELALHNDGVHHWCNLWKIERTDGTVLRFTDHDAELEFNGETYTPVDGMDSSAHQAAENFAERQWSARGIIADSAITDEDLRAGLYHDAKTTEYVIDWRFPFAGCIRKDVWWIRRTEFSAQFWTGDLAGLSNRLQRPVGRLYTRNCQHEFGGSRCTVNADAHKVSAATVTTVESRLRFESDLTSTDRLFDDGKIKFLTGDNADLYFPVKRYRHDGATYNGRVHLFIPTPYAIQTSDTFDIWPGCGRTIEDCQGTSGTEGRPWSDNSNNFGGYPHLPGDDKVLKTSDAK